MSENDKKEQKEVKKQKNPTVEDFKKQIDGSELKLVSLKGTNAIKFKKNICYIRDTNYGISVWVAVGKDANKTKQIKTKDDLVKFVDGLNKYVEKVKTETKKD